MTGYVPQVVMLSLWRNDSSRNFTDRVSHLLSKSYPRLRWVWVVGDSRDLTETLLRDVAKGHNGHRSIKVIRADTGIEGDEPEARLRRLSLTANAGLEAIRPEDDYVLIHESDLISPVDLVERFLESGKSPIAGWPVLSDVFYDIWAYRGTDGVKFTGLPPYHEAYKPDAVFEVASVGSCWMFRAEDALPSASSGQAPSAPFGSGGVRCEKWGAVELCRKLKRLGRRIWVDPTIRIEQPMGLFVARRPPKDEGDSEQ